MSGKIGYYLGLTIGFVIFYSIVVYTIFNGYQDFINNKNIIDNITLLFVIFIWRKVFHTYGMLQAFVAPFVNKE